MCSVLSNTHSHVVLHLDVRYVYQINGIHHWCSLEMVFSGDRKIPIRGPKGNKACRVSSGMVGRRVGIAPISIEHQ